MRNVLLRFTCLKLVFLLFLTSIPLSGFAQASELNKQIFYMYSTNIIPDGIAAPVPAYLRSLNDAQKLSYGSNIEKYDSLKKNVLSVYPAYVGIVESSFPGFVDLFNRSIAGGDATAVAQALKSAALVNFYAGGIYLISFLKSKASLITVNNKEVLAEVEVLGRTLALLKSDILSLKLGSAVSDADVANINAKYSSQFTGSTQRIIKFLSQNSSAPSGTGPMALSMAVTIGVLFTAVGGVYLVLVYEAAVVVGTVFWAGIVSPKGDVSLDRILKEIPYQVKGIIEARAKI